MNNMHLEMHDIYGHITQLAEELKSDYEQIRKRASEDGGTAGDRAEESWARILRKLLPKQYDVHTKGRIIDVNDNPSPQIDILVTKPEYPQDFVDKKLFLESGIAAAFECKLTLRPEHLEKELSRCAAVKKLSVPLYGTPYRELYSPIIYGILAHSYSWKNKNSTPYDTIKNKLRLYKSGNSNEWHPRECLDLVTIADLNTWSINKCMGKTFNGEDVIYVYYNDFSSIGTKPPSLSPDGSMIRERIFDGRPVAGVIGLFAALTRKLAFINPSLRSMSEYYNSALQVDNFYMRWPEGLNLLFNKTALTRHVWNAFKSRDVRSETVINAQGEVNTAPFSEWAFPI